MIMLICRLTTSSWRAIKRWPVASLATQVRVFVKTMRNIYLYIFIYENSFVDLKKIVNFQAHFTKLGVNTFLIVKISWLLKL